MKHKQLHSIAHNFADSLASGLGFVVGMFGTDVFADAASNDDGVVSVDFLNGTIKGRTVDDRLPRAISLYQKAFPQFCAKHGATESNFRQFEVRFTHLAPTTGFAVTIEDDKGRVSTEDYVGTPGKRIVKLDALGRRR
ncbi:hypothetical protein [Pelagibius sp. Alg239-R121]|uniref:hypothetical protein n=1 Tax=Pelagibius sp. Alg239-R121 TaxID=2993448 RepID=UPI0024A694CC|nr:hypothetical protein [Pelagibius sp. Alg239-R121]